MPTPIALFAYNRPRHLHEAVDTLAHCRRFDECHLHVFCDGPKGEHDEAGVRAAREVAADWSRRIPVRVVHRDRNLGLARSVVTGVTELCDTHGRVIVCEDDQQFGPDYLDYLLNGLDRYADEPSVFQIAAYMFPVEHAAAPDGFFLPLITTWGWATWQRAWRIFDWNATGALEQLAADAVRQRFNLRGTYPYSRMLEDRLAGRNDSWGILWWWSVFRANGLVLHPRRSLVWVGGFDGTGTHCGSRGGEDEAVRQDVHRFRFDAPFQYPDTVATDEPAFVRILDYLRAKQRPRQTPAVPPVAAAGAST